MGGTIGLDENPVNVKLVERILGHRPDTTVHVATRGGEAVDLAARYAADLVLLDLHLPDMSGEEVLQRLSHDPRASHMPVVVVSADTRDAQSGPPPRRQWRCRLGDQAVRH